MAETNENKVKEPDEEAVEEQVHLVSLVSSSPTARSIFRVVLIVLVLLAIKDFLGIVIYSLTNLFFMIILAVFFAYLINPLVNFFQRPFALRGTNNLLPRPIAIALANLLVFAVIGVGIAYLAPGITRQAQTFVENVPSYTASVQSTINDLNRRLDRMRISNALQDQINDRINLFLDSVGTFVTALLGLSAIYALTYLPWLVLVPILAFFFLRDAQLFRVGLLRLVPAGEWRSRVESVMTDVNRTPKAYARAQIVSCVLVGTLCTLGFYLIGNDYALILGILAGLLEFIPLIGPLTIAITATVVSGFESGWLALSTAIFLIVLRIVQDYVFYPRIIREGIHLHPVAVILSVLAGEQVAGIPGVFLAIPLVALITVLYNHILEHTESKGLIFGILEQKKKEEAVE